MRNLRPVVVCPNCGESCLTAETFHEVEQLESGEFVGDRIPGTSYVVFKARIKNSDIAKGKSAGYRLICQLKNPTAVALAAIYSKLDQSDVAAGKIRQIIREFE